MLIALIALRQWATVAATPATDLTSFTEAGVAVHGAYWHNDFGHQRSHGCVNVLAQDAKWVYRWSQPYAEYEDTLLLVKDGGTPVIVSS